MIISSTKRPGFTLTILHPLASGRCASVYRAELTIKRRLSDRSAVVKFAKKGKLGDVDFRDVLTAEARILSELSHPNIPQYIDGGIDEKSQEIYLAMAFCRGKTLYALQKQKRLYPLSIALIIYQINEALCHMHDKTGMPMREIKPDNIIVDFETIYDCIGGRIVGCPPTAFLVDFGVCGLYKYCLNDMLTMDLYGTISYHSPEAVAALLAERSQIEAVDLRTDIFSLGVVYWIALKGCSPYNFSAIVPLGESEQAHRENVIKEVMRQILNVVPSAVEGPEELLVAKMLEKDPNRRQQSCAEVRKDLEALFGIYAFMAFMKCLELDEA